MTEEQLNFLNEMRKRFESDGQHLPFAKSDLVYALQGTEHEASAEKLPDYRIQGEKDDDGLMVHGVGGNSRVLGWLFSDGSCRLGVMESLLDRILLHLLEVDGNPVQHTTLAEKLGENPEDVKEC